MSKFDILRRKRSSSRQMLKLDSSNIQDKKIWPFVSGRDNFLKLWF